MEASSVNLENIVLLKVELFRFEPCSARDVKQPKTKRSQAKEVTALDFLPGGLTTYTSKQLSRIASSTGNWKKLELQLISLNAYYNCRLTLHNLHV